MRAHIVIGREAVEGRKAGGNNRPNRIQTASHNQSNCQLAEVWVMLGNASKYVPTTLLTLISLHPHLSPPKLFIHSLVDRVCSPTSLTSRPIGIDSSLGDMANRRTRYTGKTHLYLEISYELSR